MTTMLEEFSHTTMFILGISSENVSIVDRFICVWRS